MWTQFLISFVKVYKVNYVSRNKWSKPFFYNKTNKIICLALKAVVFGTLKYLHGCVGVFDGGDKPVKREL